ncbi:MAG: SHOCT-like domain-containing protein [Chloroflexota bacterium]
MIETEQDQLRVLRMVSDGVLSPAEGADLLDALRPSPTAIAVDRAPATAPLAPARSRNLIIQISEDGESKVNLRIPIGLARAAGRFIPRQVHSSLDEHGIQLEDLLAGLASTDGVGPLLDIQDDDDRVRISVE